MVLCVYCCPKNKRLGVDANLSIVVQCFGSCARCVIAFVEYNNRWQRLAAPNSLRVFGTAFRGIPKTVHSNSELFNFVSVEFNIYFHFGIPSTLLVRNCVGSRVRAFYKLSDILSFAQTPNITVSEIIIIADGAGKCGHKATVLGSLTEYVFLLNQFTVLL